MHSLETMKKLHERLAQNRTPSPAPAPAPAPSAAQPASK